MRIRQRGVTAVEFALVLVVFFTVLLGIFDFGVVLYKWNALTEATYFGARHAVVCNANNKATVLTEMQKIVPELTSSNVKIDWYVDDAIDNTCTSSNCTGVTVSVTGITISPASPANWIGFSSLLSPGFSTYLSREIMGQDAGSSKVCI